MNHTSKLTFPAHPDYISALRLAASAVASQAGFNANEIDDIKQLTSQAFLFLMLEKCEHIEAQITEHADSLEIVYAAMQHRGEPVETQNSRYFSKVLAKSLAGKCCAIEKGKVTASFIPEAAVACKSLQTN